MAAQKISSYLTASDTLLKLSSVAEQLAKVQRTVVACLPERLARNVQVARIADKELILFANNSAIAAKVRFLIPTLLDKLQKHQADISAVKIEVKVNVSAQNNVNEKQAALSPHGVAALKTLAQSLDSSPLRTAIENMIDRNTAPLQNVEQAFQDKERERDA